MMNRLIKIHIAFIFFTSMSYSVWIFYAICYKNMLNYDIKLIFYSQDYYMDLNIDNDFFIKSVISIDFPFHTNSNSPK